MIKQELNLKDFIRQFHLDMTLEDFKKELRNDFEKEIFPKLDSLKTLKDCVDFYVSLTFWGDRLKKIIDENKLSLS